ncbi:hypothetical protein BD779DRAFT_1673425 [Infundibulicybe gibba]|nr:hypothetical protein BD779DRAFT_1673425 [Infundibulicybe gibba]
MSHTSPASFLVWAIISTMLGAFLLFHLWSFDRFRCLRWNNGSTGAFKRVMTYSYLLSVPLLMAYSIGFAIIKYTEGFVALPLFGIMPKPYQAWGPGPTRAIFPLNLAFSVAWSLEMVTHLEAGSLGSLSLTVWFTPILWTFPAFLEHLRAEGVDTSTIVRLTKFSELNTIRICFRFLFVVPLLILGVDGVRPHVHINDKMVWTDFLAVLAGFGCAISSGITLVIFFPRSIEGEIATRDAARERKRTRSLGRSSSIMLESNAQTNMSASFVQSRQEQVAESFFLNVASPVSQYMPNSEGTADGHDRDSIYLQKHWNSDEDADIAANLPTLPPLRPNRRRGQDIELGVAGTLAENSLSKHNFRISKSNVNPMIHNFTSPIGLSFSFKIVFHRLYVPPADFMGPENESRLTFSPR